MQGGGGIPTESFRVCASYCGATRDKPVARFTKPSKPGRLRPTAVVISHVVQPQRYDQSALNVVLSCRLKARTARTGRALPRRYSSSLAAVVWRYGCPRSSGSLRLAHFARLADGSSHHHHRISNTVRYPLSLGDELGSVGILGYFWRCSWGCRHLNGLKCFSTLENRRRDISVPMRYLDCQNHHTITPSWA